MLHATADDNLTRYLQEIQEFPFLTQEEELDFSKRWRDQREPAAFRQLVGSHLRLVVKIARSYSGYGLPIADLISEGNVGLVKAAEKFDPDRGFRLSTYAIWWIRATIQEYILHSWSLVKMGTTAAQKKLFFNLRRLKGRLQAIEEGDLSPEDVATISTQLGVPEDDVVSMNRRLASRDQSLNAPLREEGEGEWQDWLESNEDNQEITLGNHQELLHRRQLLKESMKALNDRERHIIIERRLKEEPATLGALSQEYGISRERVRQIEVRAFQKLQKAAKNAAWALSQSAQAAAPAIG